MESFFYFNLFCQSVLAESLGHTIQGEHLNDVFNSKHLSHKWRMSRKHDRNVILQRDFKLTKSSYGAEKANITIHEEAPDQISF